MIPLQNGCQRPQAAWSDVRNGWETDVPRLTGCLVVMRMMLRLVLVNLGGGEQMKMPSIKFILVVACAWIAASLLESVGISRDLPAAAFLALFFVGWLTYRRFVLKERLGATDLLLGAPVCLILTLVGLTETGLLGLPRAVIWIAFVVASILALGYASPPDDQPDAA